MSILKSVLLALGNFAVVEGKHKEFDMRLPVAQLYIRVSKKRRQEV